MDRGEAVSNYEPQAGDRVRVVLEGPILTGLNDESLYLRAGAFRLALGILKGAAVSMEKIEPPLPTTPGSVLRYIGDRPATEARDDLRIRGADGEWRDCHGNALLLGGARHYRVLLDTGADQ